MGYSDEMNDIHWERLEEEMKLKKLKDEEKVAQASSASVIASQSEIVGGMMCDVLDSNVLYD